MASTHIFILYSNSKKRQWLKLNHFQNVIFLDSVFLIPWEAIYDKQLMSVNMNILIVQPLILLQDEIDWKYFIPTFIGS